MNNMQQVKILLVEDDPGHARLIEKNLRRGKLSNDIVTVSDGRQALDYLFGEGDYREKGYESPLMVLLDLNLPVLHGYQVLKLIKSDETYPRPYPDHYG